MQDDTIIARKMLRIHLEENNLPLFKKLLQKYPYLVNEPDSREPILFVQAIKLNKFEIATYLLSQGFSVNAKNKVYR